MTALMLLNLLLIVAGPFVVTAPLFAVAQYAGSPSRQVVRRPRRRMQLAPSQAVFA
jgi:hypothetical protein